MINYWFMRISLALLCFAFGILLVTLPTTQKPTFMRCRNGNKSSLNDSIDDWLKWGKFYSFCMKYEGIYDLGTNDGVDEECERNHCQQCRKACLFTTNEECNSTCDNDACKNGCEFLFEGNTDTFKPNACKIPSFKNTTIGVRSYNLVGNTFSWNDIESGTVYLITVNKNVLALTSSTEYHVNFQRTCSITNRKMQHSFDIYPINNHGYKKENVIETVQDLKFSAIKDIKVGTPFFYTYPIGRNDTIFPLTVISEFHLTEMHIQFHVSCPSKAVPEAYLDYGTVLKSWKNFTQNQTKEFSYQWHRGDEFKGCSFNFEATAKYGCFKTEAFEKSYTYQGCQSVDHFPKELCQNTTTLKSTMMPASSEVYFNISCVKATCTACNLYKTNEEKFKAFQKKCLEGYYTITVNWYPQNEPLYRYGVIFWIASSILNITNVYVLVPKNETSFSVRNISAGSTFTVQVMRFAPDPFIINRTEVPIPGREEQVGEKHENEPSSANSSNFQNTGNIVLGVVISVTVMIINNFI